MPLPCENHRCVRRAQVGTNDQYLFGKFALTIPQDIEACQMMFSINS